MGSYNGEIFQRMKCDSCFSFFKILKEDQENDKIITHLAGVFLDLNRLLQAFILSIFAKIIIIACSCCYGVNGNLQQPRKQKKERKKQQNKPKTKNKTELIKKEDGYCLRYRTTPRFDFLHLCMIFRLIFLNNCRFINFHVMSFFEELPLRMQEIFYILISSTILFY